MNRPRKTDAELIAIAIAELGDHGFYPDGLNISVIRTGETWEFRTAATPAAEEAPGYADCVARLVQIGDHLSTQYDRTA
ncbi:hypothetical protein [Bradyrhizobium sp. 2TAF24]|uniref:hypothetical protein n=1 Tax=Bradyrhizobium sp. 2TAF24 TaxID=3233011 RepID=UPI003F8E7441